MQLILILIVLDSFLLGVSIGWLLMDHFFYSKLQKLNKEILIGWEKTLDHLTDSMTLLAKLTKEL